MKALASFSRFFVLFLCFGAASVFGAAKDVKAQLLVFSAPPCSDCKVTLPRVKQKLDGLTPQQLAAVAVQLWVETGRGWNDAPTIDVAKKYAEEEGFLFPVFIDSVDSQGRPSYQKLRELTEGVLGDISVPTAVILDANGNFFDMSRREQDVFVIDDGGAKLIAALLSHLN